MQSLLRAVVLVGAYNITVIDVPKPTILNGTDAIVRIASSAICGSDLHYYHLGQATPEDPMRIGHEAIGYVEQVGDSVSTLAAGDWAVIRFMFDDGHFEYGPSLDAQPSGRQGMQAEYTRVTFADDSLMPVPINGSADTSTIHDYLFMSDILATGWAALDFAGLLPGDTVAVFGAGPVGQMAVLSAGLRGASKIYVVDRVQDRLDLAASHGAIPVNFAEEDPVEALRRFEPAGVTRVVDCAGRIVAPSGGIGVVGVYGDGDQVQNFNIRDVFMGGFSVRGGVSSPLSLGTEMLNIIGSGKVRPSSIVSAVIGIEQAPEYYERFSRREETKVVINFP
ncbi:alcohol dehydrogenase GroES-like domain-containing protein [Colletotrichum gloeosporioides Cg-14]|uniref:Alcohol dehydrogenase GroES-like domain-containing protein n=1 Tax=Colletotrichum gloeosporioides (strain Cg-14) TaxID=1237896 RepID=T0KW06_COLGC|nr:alcohol dehydrogenase GroES-like domain-containing protein [Colletotrichum gloeosporioides Cg-14]